MHRFVAKLSLCKWARRDVVFLLTNRQLVLVVLSTSIDFSAVTDLTYIRFDEETGTVVYGPEIVSKGFVFETETGHLLQDAQCVILEIVEEIGPEVPDRIVLIRKKVLTALKKYFFYTIRRRPVILPFILVI